MSASLQSYEQAIEGIFAYELDVEAAIGELGETLSDGLQEKQLLAFNSPATEILYGGAAFGGKSHLKRVAAIEWCKEIPGLQVYLFRRTHPDLMKNHMEGPTSFPILLGQDLLKKTVKINYSNGSIEFSNASKIFLCHCQYDKDVNKFLGAEIHVLMIDELTTFTEKIYRFLRGRVRMTGVKVPDKYLGRFPRILCGSNPGSIGHNWVKQFFIEGRKALQIERMPPKEGGMLRQFIPARLEDNVVGLKEDPDYEARLEGLGNPDLIRAMRRGDWDIVAGGMFDDLWNEGGKRKVHTIAKFEIPRTWRIDRTFDWGSSKPFAVLWWAESNGEALEDGRCWPKGTLFLVDEWYGWNGKANEGLKMSVNEIAAGIKERQSISFPSRRIAPGAADSSIWDVENNKSLYADFLAKGVEWLKADKSPGSRKQGWEKLRRMLKASLKSPMEEEGLFVFDHCHQFIRTFPVLPRDEKDSDDVDTKSEDHIGDAARYKVLSRRKGVGVSNFTR